MAHKVYSFDFQGSMANVKVYQDHPELNGWKHVGRQKRIRKMQRDSKCLKGLPIIEALHVQKWCVTLENLQTILLTRQESD